AADAGSDELAYGVLLERANGAGADVRDRRQVEHEAAVGELAHERGILDRPEPVPDPVRRQVVERAAHGLRADDFARVRNRAETGLAGGAKGRGEGLVRVVGLLAAEADGDDPALPVPRRHLDEPVGVL